MKNQPCSCIIYHTSHITMVFFLKQQQEFYSTLLGMINGMVDSMFDGVVDSIVDRAAEADNTSKYYTKVNIVVHRKSRGYFRRFVV